jgi:hypothetical protein
LKNQVYEENISGRYVYFCKDEGDEWGIALQLASLSIGDDII